VVEFNLVLKTHVRSKIKVSTYDFCNADADAVERIILQHPCNFLTPTGSVDDAWPHFIDPDYRAIHDHVPVKIRQSSGKTSKGWHMH